MHASVQHLEGDSCQIWVDVGVEGVVFGEAEVMDEAVLSSLLLWYETQGRDDSVGERDGGKRSCYSSFRRLLLEFGSHYLGVDKDCSMTGITV